MYTMKKEVPKNTVKIMTNLFKKCKIYPLATFQQQNIWIKRVQKYNT